jgi:EAL and modified HD-GYP domain-containing signal transduction protein
MLSWKKLFGGNDERDATRPTAAPDSGSPSAAPPEADAPPAFLRREPVFDRKNHLTGHLFYLQQASPLADAPRDLQRQVDARLLDILATSKQTWNAQLAFLPLSSASLDHVALERLPDRNIVLLIQLAADESDAQALGARLSQLRERGIGVGIFRQPRHALYGLAAQYANIGTLDVADCEANIVREYSAAFRAADSPFPIHLFGINIETPDEHRLCAQWHFDYFHGPFAASAPPRPEANQADPHKVQLLHLLRLVQGDAENAEIAEAMKQDPMLTFRILRYLNSAALGLNHRIESLGQTLLILGRQRLTRWLSVLLFSVREPDFADWMLVESALTRGRLMEVLGGKLLPGQPRDALFLTGILSCLDRLLRRPMVEIIESLPIAEEIRLALLERRGPFAPLLAVAQASEAFDVERMQSTAAAAGLAPEDVNHALLDATAWASEVTEHWE